MSVSGIVILSAAKDLLALRDREGPECVRIFWIYLNSTETAPVPGA